MKTCLLSTICRGFLRDNEGDFTEQKEQHILQWQKDILENMDKYVVKEDDLINKYDCAKCGGRCCTNTDVILYPYDVWRIVNAPEVSKPLGIETTHDLFTSKVEGKEPFLKYYLGPNSRLPVASINMMQVDENFRICPFNAPVVVIRNKNDFKNLKEHNLEKLNFIRSKFGNLSRLCTLEDAKPTICRAYPLGRAGTGKTNKEPYENGIPKMNYVKIDTEWCDKFAIPCEELKVKDYVKKWGLDESYKMSDLFYKWHMDLASKVKDENRRYVIGLYVYDFDWVAEGLAEKDGLNKQETYDLVQTFRPKSFEDLIERAYKLIEIAGKVPDNGANDRGA